MTFSKPWSGNFIASFSLEIVPELAATACIENQKNKNEAPSYAVK